MALNLKQIYQLSPAHTYAAGYSDGAEVITYNLLTKDRSSWLQGGVIMIAGGGTLTNTARVTKVTPHAKNKTIRATWYVGDKDKAGETNPPTWSAFSASLEGQAQYKKYGYTRAERLVLKNQGHHGYKLAGLISGRIYAVPAPKPAAKPKLKLKAKPKPKPKKTPTKRFVSSKR